MPNEHERFMRIALDEAAKAKSEANVPVGSVIVRDGKVVGRGHNLEHTTKDPTAHAEIAAIRNASLELASADLSGCTLYTTFEPCPMCCGAIMWSGIARVVMGARNEPGRSRWGGYTVERLLDMSGWSAKTEVVTGVLTSECADIRI